MHRESPALGRAKRTVALATLVTLLSADVTLGQSPSVWNVLDHGAEREADISDVLDEGLRTQRDHGLPVFIPGGTYFLDRPLVLPRVDGVVLHGVGPSHPRSTRGQFRGATTRLVYRGPSDQPAIVNQSTRFALSGLTLLGRLPGSDAPRPRVGYLMVRKEPGLGVGKASTSRVTFAEFDTAIQLGIDAWEGSNDASVWEEVSFFDCREAVRLVNYMAMGHHFQKLLVRNTPTVFAIQGGGDLHVSDALLFDTTLFRFTGDNPRRARPGANNGTISATNLKVDAQHRGAFVLVDSEVPSSAHVIAQRVRVSGADSFTIARLAPSNRLTMRDVDGPGVGTIECSVPFADTPPSERQPTVRLDNVGLTVTFEPGATAWGDGVRRVE